MAYLVKMKKHLQIFTNSSTTCFRRCPKEYYYRYVLLRRTEAKAEALVFGSAIHRALNVWWMASELSPLKRLNQAIETIGNCNLDQFTRVKAEELLMGYTAMWGDVNSTIVGVEQKFEIERQTFSMNPYTLTGSIDAITSEHIVEHKTSSMDIQPHSDYWEHIQSLDGQVSTYLEGVREIGLDITKCMYDVIHKVKLEPLKATPKESRKYTKAGELYKGQREQDEDIHEFRARVRADIVSRPSYYFVRQMIVRLPQQFEDHLDDIDSTVRMIRYCDSSKSYPRHTNACDRFGRKCEYHRVCCGNDSIDSNNFYTATEIHEELV